MKIKDGTIKLYGIRPELAIGLCIVDSVHTSIIGHDILITSLAERTTRHNYSSLHYSGCAADIRKYSNMDSLNSQLISNIKMALGSEFDVIDETTHIHIEFQPKFD